MLAKLFAQSEKTTDLDALLGESELVILPEVEPVFRAAGLYSALCKVYSKRGLDAELLEVWSKYARSSLPAFLALLTTQIADLSRASGWILGFQTPCRICSRYSRHGVTVR